MTKITFQKEYNKIKRVSRKQAENLILKHIQEVLKDNDVYNVTIYSDNTICFCR
jgi:hypothetical protein